MSKSARQIAFEILLKIEKDEAYSNLAIDSAVKAYNADSTDCAFISKLVYGVLERKITLDYIIEKELSSPLKKLKKEALTILRIGVYQLVFTDKIPVSAAVNESVKLAKANKCQYAAGLVNAVLRKVSSKGFVLDDSLSDEDAFSIKYSTPKELVLFLIHHYGKENTEAFLKASLEPKKIIGRVNSVKTDRAELFKLLEAEGASCRERELENAFELKLNNSIGSLKAFKDGLFHVEDISSQLCVEALDLFEGCTAIDLCAAPGGKTFTAAEKMNNKGVLYSCDIYPQRVGLIEEGAERLGLSCIKAIVNDASVFNDVLPLADRVLCDVPCSGLGIITKKPEIKYKKLDDAKALFPVQREILEVSSRYVKSGGRLVYSTCSVNPNENRKICDAFLKCHPEFYSIKALEGIKRTVDEGDYLTLFPHTNNCDGFFIAVFMRK